MPDVLFEKVSDVLQGGSIGSQVPLPSLDVDGRTIALETLKTFVSLCEFSRTGPSGEAAKVYRLPRENFFPEQPDEVENLPMPSIGVLAGEGAEDSYVLGPPRYIEETADVYGPGTAVVWVGSYIEEMNFEIWAANKADRRSMVVGMQDVLTYCEESGNLRLKLPKYFDQIAIFTLLGTRYIDDTDTIRKRRRAHLRVQLEVPRVKLARYKTLITNVAVVAVDVDVDVTTSTTVTSSVT